MDLPDVAAGVVLAAAAVTALRYLIKFARGGFRTLEDADELLGMTRDLKALVERELTHNHGTSMKDDTYGTAISARLAHERIDQVYELFSTFAEANNLVLPLIHDAIKATPPTDEGNPR